MAIRTSNRNPSTPRKLTFRTLFPKLKRVGFVSKPTTGEHFVYEHPEGAVLLINKLPPDTEVGPPLLRQIETLMAVYGIGNGKPLTMQR